jgi:hypothetical protein
MLHNFSDVPKKPAAGSTDGDSWLVLPQPSGQLAAREWLAELLHMVGVLCDQCQSFNAVREIDTPTIIERWPDVCQPLIIDQFMQM